MSDSDDDYMSDKLLIGCQKEDVRPGLLFNNNLKRRHEVYKKQQEERLKKPKSYHEQEKETREKGLSTAISAENKGFKLLEKMGYKAGTGLGKSVTGITEPVGIKTKEGAAGVGRDQHLKETIEKRRDLKETTFKAKEKEFRSTNAERRNMMMLHKDYKKAQRTCEELDLQSGIEAPELPFFWSKQTVDSLKQKNKAKAKEKSEDEEEEEEAEEEEPEDINEPKLCDMIMYLRRKYCYCMYCGDYIEESRGSVILCPGYFRKDHDE